MMVDKFRATDAMAILHLCAGACALWEVPSQYWLTRPPVDYTLRSYVHEQRLLLHSASAATERHRRLKPIACPKQSSVTSLDFLTGIPRQETRLIRPTRWQLAEDVVRRRACQ